MHLIDVATHSRQCSGIESAQLNLKGDPLHWGDPVVHCIKIVPKISTHPHRLKQVKDVGLVIENNKEPYMCVKLVPYLSFPFEIWQ